MVDPMDLGPEAAPEIPRVRTRASEAASETAFALLDGLWLGPVGIAFFDRDLRVMRANEHLALMAGRSAEALVGRTLRELAPDRADLAAQAEARLSEVFETGRPAAAVAISGVLGGLAREWRLGLFPVQAGPGAARAVCALVNDVTSDREREETLQRARDSAERAARRLGVLQEITAALSAALDPAAVAEVVVNRVRVLLGPSSAAIWTVSGDTLERLALDGDPGAARERIALDEATPAARAVLRDQALWLEGPEVVEERFPGLLRGRPALAGGSLVAIPLVARGMKLGALGLVFPEAHHFDLEERASMLAVAEQCAQALDRATLYASERDALVSVRSSSRRIAQLQAFTAALAGARTGAQVAEELVARAMDVLGADGAVAYLAAPGEPALALRAERGFGPEDEPRAPALPVDAPGVIPAAVRSGRSFWLESPEAIGAAFPEAGGRSGRVGARVVSPFVGAAGVVGALGMEFRQPRRFDGPLRDVLHSAVDQCTQAFDRVLLFDAEHRARAEAERVRSLLDGLLENLPLGSCLLDTDLRFVRVNAALATINGAPVEAHLGRTLREVLPGMGEQIEAAYRRVAASGQAIETEMSGETPAAPGKQRHWVASMYPVRAGGAMLGMGALVREVTAEREAAEFQRHVLGIVGHDLRNPLSAIVAAAKMLARGDDVTARQARLVQRLQSGADRMEQIVRVLLDYTQVRAGQGVPVHPRPCDLAALCRAVADECEAAHAGREVRCEGEGDGTGEWDPDRVAQVLTNLVTNALDYSPRESPVDLRWRDRGPDVQIEVSNAGRPIPPELLPRLFDPFRRGERERRGGQGGVGLGLFIARAIVTAHGGHIEARSSAERTAFLVRLPRVPPRAR